jgi:hypothetical protein
MRSKTAAALLIVAVSVGLAPPAGAADTPDAAPPPSTAPAQILHYGRFGDVSVYASGEDGDAACTELTGSDGRAIKMPGGHHFDGSYPQITAEI